MSGEPGANRADEVKRVCEELWPANQSDCSAFVRAVAAKFKVTLSGNADAIVQEIKTAAGWERLPDGAEAKNAADGGKLVVAGLAGSDEIPPVQHGHVVIVVAGLLDDAHGKYPTAYWGKLNGVGRENTTINWAWKRADIDRVIYAARAVEDDIS